MKVRREIYPLVTADVALFCVTGQCLQVLLVERGNEPYKHRWALPGGVLDPDRDENLESLALRVLREKIDVKIGHLAQVATFSGPDRDPRGWSLSALYYAMLPRDQIQAMEKHKVESLRWVPAHAQRSPLAFDHLAQLETAIGSLQRRVHDGDLPLHLLPDEFTLTELQRTCEAILNAPLDKSAFRRRLKDSADIVETGRQTEGGRQRPAQIFRARQGFSWS